jgi:hypothetical protein
MCFPIILFTVLAKVQANTCHLPHENRSAVLITVAATIFAVTFVFVALRMVSRIRATNTIGLDDWIIVLALVSTRLVDGRIYYLALILLVPVALGGLLYDFE